MKEFDGKVAVVTGAASGIGRALAEKCVREGMKVVLADIEEAALEIAEQELKASGADILAVVTDVSKESDIQALAQKTLERFGAVHLLFNNAGVGAGTLVWQSTIADWQWVLNVNLWGAIYATRIFVPIMLNQATEGYIVNTASEAGLVTGPLNGVYRVSKHALVCFTETLYHELKLANSRIGVGVLCPGFVKTQICDAERNRPEALRNPTDQHSPQGDIFIQFIREAVQKGMAPEEIAERTFTAIRNNQFYILPDPEIKAGVRGRMEAILNETNPTFTIPESYRKGK